MVFGGVTFAPSEPGAYVTAVPAPDSSPPAGSIEGVCVHHRLNYIELPAPDLAAAKAFYGAVFGWAFTDWGDAYVEFTGAGVSGGFDAAGTPNAGGGTVVMVYSDDLPATEAAVRGAGGTITEPAFDFPGGRRFHFADPAGNELAVWTSRPLS